MKKAFLTYDGEEFEANVVAFVRELKELEYLMEQRVEEDTAIAK